MITTALKEKKIDTKALFSAGMVAAAALLPQVFHLAGGASAGARFLPMYIPVLVAGLVFGGYWGFFVGIASPLLSFLLTGMPIAARLPYMVLELAFLGAFAGMFSKRNVFIRILLAQIASRLAMVALLAALQLDPLRIWTALTLGYTGVLLQLAAVPAVVWLFNKVYAK
jgi:riboflavin transporter FmnP